MQRIVMNHSVIVLTDVSEVREAENEKGCWSAATLISKVPVNMLSV